MEVMYTNDRYFDAVNVVSRIIKDWEQQTIHEDWELSLAESIVAALSNANLLK